MIINMKTKFDLGNLVIHKTAPGIILMIVGIKIFSNKSWDYECSYVINGEVILNTLAEYELELYNSQKSFVK